MNTNILHEIKKMYEDGMSTHQIGEKFNMKAGSVCYRLKKMGVILRDKSSAQKTSLATGISKHPTKGRKRTIAEKLAISEGSAKFWENLPEAERKKKQEELVKRGKNIWKNMTEEQKENLRKASIEGIRKSSVEGSIIERTLYSYLISENINAEFHVKNLIPDPDLEVDIWIPKLKIVVEIDGPGHFFPLWGEETLKKVQEADQRKNGLILSHGLVMLRIQNKKTQLSQKNIRDICKEAVRLIKNVALEFPPPGQRLLKVEL